MVNLSFTPRPSRTSWFVRPRYLKLRLHSNPTVRVTTFSPFVSYYRGTIEPGRLRPFNFHRGRVGVRVVASSNNLLLTYSPTHQFTQGRLTVHLGGIPADGALTDFAVWPVGLKDPKDYYVHTAQSVTSGAVGGAWTRPHVTFVPHRNTRYIGVGSKWTGVPVPDPGAVGGPWNYLKKVQLETAPVGATFPTPYTKAREVRVTLQPKTTLSNEVIAARYAMVKRILEENVPMGIGVADPIFLPPA